MSDKWISQGQQGGGVVKLTEWDFFLLLQVRHVGVNRRLVEAADGGDAGHVIEARLVVRPALRRDLDGARRLYPMVESVLKHLHGPFPRYVRREAAQAPLFMLSHGPARLLFPNLGHDVL